MPYINPYEEEPSDFLLAVGPFVYHKGGNGRGEYTEKSLQLNRPELIERRKEKVNIVRQLYDRYKTESNSSLKQVIHDELIEEIAKNKQYSMIQPISYLHRTQNKTLTFPLCCFDQISYCFPKRTA